MSDAVDFVEETVSDIGDSLDEGIEFAGHAVEDILIEGVLGGSLARGIDSIFDTDIHSQIYDPITPSNVRESKRNRDDQRAARAQADSEAGVVKRDQIYNDALNNRDIDSITKKEIERLYGSGASLDQISSLISQAKEGKGIFGIRRIANENKKKREDQPGRNALLGRSTIL